MSKKFENDAVFLDQIPEFENVETIKLEKDYLKVIYTNLFFTFNSLYYTNYYSKFRII